MIYRRYLFVILLLASSLVRASCAATTPWNTPAQLSNSGDITSNVFSAAALAGFMAVWADSANNAHYSFSSDGATWQTGLITPAEGDLAASSDVFVAGNGQGFLVAWIDSANNGWSSFTADHGTTWSEALQINPNTLPLDSNSDVYVSGGTSGFIATMIGDDRNGYVSFSNGTDAWGDPAQVTDDGSVHNQNLNSQTSRGFISAVVAGAGCMLTWITNPLGTASAYFSSINPFSSTTVDTIGAVGFYESVPIVTYLNGYYMAAARANVSDGVTYFSVATITSNWADFSIFLTVNPTPQTGPWVASNSNGFMATWVVGAGANDPGTPMWTFSSNNGFNWTPLCSILQTESTTIVGPIGLCANNTGFAATWLDSNDSNAYASFYATPASSDYSLFVKLLQQKYGPLL